MRTTPERRMPGKWYSPGGRWQSGESWSTVSRARTQIEVVRSDAGRSVPPSERNRGWAS